MITEQEQGQTRDALLPVLIKAQFAASPHAATIHMFGTGPAHLVITAIHEARSETRTIDFDAADSSGGNVIMACDQESVTILARYEGHIAACGIYEVSLRQAERIGIVLVPCVEQGIVLSQYEEEAERVADTMRIMATSLVGNEVAQ